MEHAPTPTGSGTPDASPESPAPQPSSADPAVRVPTQHEPATARGRATVATPRAEDPERPADHGSRSGALSGVTPLPVRTPRLIPTQPPRGSAVPGQSPAFAAATPPGVTVPPPAPTPPAPFIAPPVPPTASSSVTTPPSVLAPPLPSRSATPTPPSGRPTPSP